MDGLYWKTLLKWMIWGYPYFWKHPDDYLLPADLTITLKLMSLSRRRFDVHLDPLGEMSQRIFFDWVETIKQNKCCIFATMASAKCRQSSLLFFAATSFCWWCVHMLRLFWAHAFRFLGSQDLRWNTQFILEETCSKKRGAFRWKERTKKLL